MSRSAKDWDRNGCLYYEQKDVEKALGLTVMGHLGEVGHKRMLAPSTGSLHMVQVWRLDLFVVASRPTEDLRQVGMLHSARAGRRGRCYLRFGFSASNHSLGLVNGIYFLSMIIA